MAMDVVDCKVKGAVMHFVETELNPGEAAVGEAGSRSHMAVGIGMDSVLGDGDNPSGGFFGKLLGVGKRRVTGEALLTIDYTNNTANKLRVAFGAPDLGKILPLDLAAT